MDGDVHLHSRRVELRRLCFYFTLTIVILLIILPICSWLNAGFDAAKTINVVHLTASHPVSPGEPAPVRTAADTTIQPESTKPAKSVVKVKMLYHTIIQQASVRYGVESAMIKAIIMAESSYNPKAVSNRGAVGLMQLMPTTADSMGVKDRFDPKHNIDGGVRYFKRLLVRFEGDIHLALAAYNAGSKKVKQYNGIPPYKATRSYIEKVFQYYQRYKDLENDRPNRV